jgi:hypothetical protein
MCAYPTVKWNNRSPIAAIWYNGSKNVVSLYTEHVSGKASAADPLPLSVFHRLSRFHTTFFSFSPPFSASPPPKFIYPASFVPFLDYWARKWTEMMILTSFG